MKKRKLLIIVFIALTFGFFACQKSDFNSADSGPSTLGVKIQALNKSFTLPVNGTKSAELSTSSITWDTVQMVVSTVKFEAKLKSMDTYRDSVEISYKWTGPTMASLLDSSLFFGEFILQPGFYDEIEIGVQGLKDDANPEPVFYMTGQYINGEVTVIPVRFETYSNIEFKTEKDSVDVSGDNIDFTSYVQLYLDKLMTDISPEVLDNATLTGGVILISEERNRDIYYIVMRNLARDHHCEYKHEDRKENKEKYHDDDD